MQQLTIFDALDDIAVQNGRNTFKQDIMQLIAKRLFDWGIAEHFDFTDTKIFLRTCVDKEIIFMSLLSPTSYLKEVHLYPVGYYSEDCFSLIDENGMFRDGRWLHAASVIEHCNFNSNWFYDGFYVTAAERSIEGIIKTGFYNDWRYSYGL